MHLLIHEMNYLDGRGYRVGWIQCREINSVGLNGCLVHQAAVYI